MAKGKNAKKREARKAFHNDPLAQAGGLPFAFHVVEHREGKPRKLTFASLTSYKAYLVDRYETKEVARLLLLHGHDASVKDTGDSFRSMVISAGQDTSKAKPKAIPKGNAILPSVRGGRFRKEGFATTAYDVVQGQCRDMERKVLIESEQVRECLTSGLLAIRQKYRTI